MGGGITAGRDLLLSNAGEQAREGGVSGPVEDATGEGDQQKA